MGRPVQASGPTDEALVALAGQGREDALAQLYDRHGADVYRAVMRISGDRAVAEEVVQEAFLVLWQRAGLFDRERGSVGAWLASIARNRAIDRARAASRRSPTSPFSTFAAASSEEGSTAEWLVASGEPVASGIAEPHPEAAAVRAEVVSELARVLKGLPDEERVPILLAYRWGLTQSEIAMQLGWPLGTVKTRSRRALLRLRRAMETAESGTAATAAPDARWIGDDHRGPSATSAGLGDAPRREARDPGAPRASRYPSSCCGAT
jgi:RNA polymerase sigma-70 factor (ECF subfamily)